jgi:hypothetical protein
MELQNSGNYWVCNCYWVHCSILCCSILIALPHKKGWYGPNMNNTIYLSSRASNIYYWLFALDYIKLYIK